MLSSPATTFFQYLLRMLQKIYISKLISAFCQVSHDEHLISGSVEELWAVSEGRVTPFHGTFQDYKKILQSQSQLTYFVDRVHFYGNGKIDG